MPDLLSAVGGLKGVFDTFQKLVEHDRQRWDRVATYFTDISQCLTGMARSFENSDIPYEDGNALKVHIGTFEPIAHTIYSKKYPEERKTVEELITALRDLAGAATIMDTIMLLEESKRSVSADQKRKEIIRELKRTSGRLKGLASAIRAEDI